jgi:uncharacterized protein (TIGR03437 family)
MPYINAQGQVSPQPANTVPFYRAAYQGKNLHFWTPDADEFFGRNGRRLPTGYFGEGVACYIFPATGAPLSSAGADDAPTIVAAVSSGGYTPLGIVAPGQRLSLIGSRLGGKVWWNGEPVEAHSTADREMTVVAPAGLAGSSEAIVEVEHSGRRSRPLVLEVTPANPVLFGTDHFGRGHAQARNRDGTMNGAERPAARGSVVTLYAGGLGALDLPLAVRVGGKPAEVLSRRESATRPGLTEVEIRIPDALERSDFQPVVLQIGFLSSQPGIGLAIE